MAATMPRAGAELTAIPSASRPVRHHVVEAVRGLDGRFGHEHMPGHHTHRVLNGLCANDLPVPQPIDHRLPQAGLSGRCTRLGVHGEQRSHRPRYQTGTTYCCGSLIRLSVRDPTRGPAPRVVGYSVRPSTPPLGRVTTPMITSYTHIHCAATVSAMSASHRAAVTKATASRWQPTWLALPGASPAAEATRVAALRSLTSCAKHGFVAVCDSKDWPGRR